MVAGVAGAVGGAPVPAAVGGDVPEGHVDRPWLERLSVAREKQKAFIGLQGELTQKQQEAGAYTSQGQEIPEELDDRLIELETGIDQVQAQLVCLRWTLGLDPAKDLTLDEALERAGLTPYMENPQPRVLPEPVGA